jgi:hypothetical protein
MNEIKHMDQQKKQVSERWWKQKAEDFLLSDNTAITATKFLLAFAALGGIAIVGANVPGIVRLIGDFSRKHRFKTEYSQKKIGNSFAYLRKKRLLEIVGEKSGRVRVKLTNKGKKRLTEYSLGRLEIKKPKKWDRKWRVLIFDIPSYPKRYNGAREALRDKIKELGFCQIQKSVWVYPYECEDEMLFIAEMFQVQQYIEILVVEKFLHTDVLEKRFPHLY